jgi:Secretion system C-terminal sorting domain
MVGKFDSRSTRSGSRYLLENILIIFFLAITSSLFGQIVLTIEGTFINNTESGSWEGVNIPRSEPVSFIYRNNSVTSINSNGYMLQAGDEGENSQNNHLDGMIISGNQFTWNGTEISSITHALFTGYNVNAVVKYNYLDKTPHGILFKSGTEAGRNMIYTSGGAGYNILKNARLSIRIKGINGVGVYNNTFYNDTDTDWALSIIQIDANHDRNIPSPSLGARIFNNIFYTKYQIPNIRIESECLSDFDSDYNVFYCETGTPVFVIGDALKTFTEWQTMGYDTHSVVVNPDFINTTGFVPQSRLDYGTDLGMEWQTGLSASATWSSVDPATTAQNGTWQAGARIVAAGNENKPITIYPNPAVDHINISINKSTGTLDYIRIINLTRIVVFQNKMNPDEREIQIPINLLPGIYLIEMGLKNRIAFTEKLVVTN